jgi:nucleoid DNA-binding protein
LITEDQIVREIYKRAKTKTTMKDIDVIVADVFDVIKEHLIKGENVFVADFGTFAPDDSIKKSFVEMSKVKNKE